jgi:hypothetical protein
MHIVNRLRTYLPAAVLLAGCAVALAAPAPAARTFSDKFLPEDADFVLVVNVKQLTSSPLYTRHFRKKIEDLLGMPQVPQWAKDLAAAVPQDVERMTIAMGRSSHPTEEAAHRDGPVIIVEGRLDALREAAKRLAKDHPEHVKEVKVGDATGYELTGPAHPEGFVVWPDAHTLFYSPRREQVVETLDKAAGKNKTRVKSKALRDLLGKFKPEATIQWAGTKEMVISSMVVVNASDMGRTERKVTLHTLADSGIETMTGTVTAGEELKGRSTLTTKDEAAAKQLSDKITQGLDEAKANLKRFAGAQPQGAAVLKALDALNVSSGERTVTFQATLDATAIEGMVMGLFTLGPIGPPPTPERLIPLRKP